MELKQIRLDLGISVAKASYISKLSRNTINKIENEVQNTYEVSVERYKKALASYKIQAKTDSLFGIAGLHDDAENEKNCLENAIWYTTDFFADKISLCLGDAIRLYHKWETPTVIMSDGPYGISGFEGDMKNARQLPEWYEPHIVEWSKRATPQTTLWFWNTELGWANVHPILEKHGWEYKCCHIWDKGKGHIAGATNTKTLTKLPVVT